jgi:hypothetical protein
MPGLEWSAWSPPLLAVPFVGSFLRVLIMCLPELRPVALAGSCRAIRMTTASPFGPWPGTAVWQLWLYGRT